MICINCFHPRTKVTNSRPAKKATGGTWRRRQCLKCQQLFSTLEVPTDHLLQVSGNSSSQNAPFSLSRLTLSIGKSFAHDEPVGKTSALDLARTVEQSLVRNQSIPSLEDLAILTHQTIGRFDNLAAMQYGAQHDLLLSTRRAGRPSVTLANRASSQRS